jgi:hypothetical protein
VRAYGGKPVRPRSTSGALARVCPVCDAQVGWRCFRLNSWVGPVPLIGFFTERQNSPHVDRRRPSDTITEVRRKLRENKAGSIPVRLGDSDQARPPTVEDRMRVRALIDAKLTQNRKGPARTYVQGPHRTQAEILAMIEKLETMPDVRR